MTVRTQTVPIFVAGATGYVGGRLVPQLLKRGYTVRILVRNPAKLQGRDWSPHPRLEVITGDILDRNALTQLVNGCGVGFYLIHSMQTDVENFMKTDREAATNMVETAEAAGLKRIIYLSGLGEEGSDLSCHLRSRAEVGKILSAGPVPVTILRAAMIIGSGSASFAILRHLVERLPIMVTPRWVNTPCQPISIRNVLGYLIGCLENEKTLGKTFDIGQERIVTYRELMDIYAEVIGLRHRLILPVPILSPRLSSYWIHIFTPVPASLAKPLAQGLRNPVICRESQIRSLIPQRLLDCREAIQLASGKVRSRGVETSWRDAGSIPVVEESMPGDPAWSKRTRYKDSRKLILAASLENTWKAVAALGGKTGWYYANWLWTLRGLLDRLAGGVGLQRGRRLGQILRPGDAVDFWRVAVAEKDKKLVLASEMKLPGEAVLEFHLEEIKDGQVEVRQIARFSPKGLSGILYWHAVSPLHNLVFDGMLRGIGKASGGEIIQGPQRSPDAGK
jgi:uncharacterized protein YbjT (DUF2867 family)